MTNHKIVFDKSQNMSRVDDNSVNLIVTSPPYPMIEMWDNIFSEQNSKFQLISKKRFEDVFELMHCELDKVWRECYRVLKEGGIACINIGDATRTIDENFRLFSNHSRIISGMIGIGFQNLPNIIWRKQTNAPNRFMGSGMLPPGAYVTLEHEFILIFRKGRKRKFRTKEEKENRQNSSYFWEERNIWFSDLWNIKGVRQKISDEKLRNRSAAYPFELPYRLINMFSTQNDIIVDPFIGTGTTILAAIASKRNSISYEIDRDFRQLIFDNIRDKEQFLNNYTLNRIERHISFVKDRVEKKGSNSLKYLNKYYKFPVVTRQEININFPLIRDISIVDEDIEVRYFDYF